MTWYLVKHRDIFYLIWGTFVY